MRRLLLLFTILGCIHLSYAEKDHQILYDWQNFTRSDKAYASLAVDDNTIYYGCSRGIITINKKTGEQKLIDRSKGLVDNCIITLKKMDDGIWYGALHNGFGVLQGEQIINYTSSSVDLPYGYWTTAIEKDKDGILWVASLWYLCKIVNGKYVEVYEFPHSEISTHQQISDILADDDGSVWVTGYAISGEVGLGLLTDEGISIVDDASGECTSMIKDAKGNKWVGAQNGLVRFEKDSFKEISRDASGNSLKGLCNLQPDAEGMIWASRDSSLIRYDGKDATSYHVDDWIIDLAVDHEDIYISTMDGRLLKFKDGSFETIDIETFPGLIPFSNVGMSRGGSIDHNGDYLAGTTNYGLLKMKPDGTCVQPDLFKNKIVSISETVTDNNGDILVVTHWGNIYKITKTDTIDYKTDKQSPFTAYDDIFQVAVDRTDKLWIAASNGLHCFDGEKWLSYNKDNSGLTTNRVYSVAFDKLGRLWTCCGVEEGQYREWGDGLFCYDFMRWRHYANSQLSMPTKDSRIDVDLPFPTNTFGPIAIDEDGVFWMAGNRNELYYTVDIDDWHGGLIRWDGKEDFKLFLRYNKDLPYIGTGLPGNWINCIEFDKYGRVWLGFEGYHGIAMYDGKDFTVWDQDVPGIGYGQTFNIAIDNERDRIWVSHRYEGGASTAKMLGTSTDIRSIPLPEPSSNPDDSDRIFDLSGRALKSTPSPGVYIRNGKKFVVK